MGDLARIPNLPTCYTVVRTELQGNSTPAQLFLVEGHVMHLWKAETMRKKKKYVVNFIYRLLTGY